MSRVGRKPVSVPGGVKVSIADRMVTIEGSKGTLKFEHRPEVTVEWTEASKELGVTIPEGKGDDRVSKALWGTTRAILSNMVEGVSKGYEKKLEIVGVGWNAQQAGTDLKVNVGYADPVMIAIPDGVSVAVDKQLVTVSGADKQKVGQFAAEVRASRPPEPYNGKGVKYADEVIQKKAGKSAQ
ncbi:MAG: 50S ribosomal protein L6 [Planctomycetota bacterium]